MFAVLLLQAGPAHAVVREFTGAVSTSWLTDANWSPPGAPADNDDVVIPGGKTVDLSVARVVSSLTLAGALGGTGTLSVTGSTTWSAGAMSGSGALNANGHLAISGTGAKLLGRTLNNASDAVWSDVGNITMGPGAVLANLPGATFRIDNNSTIAASGGSPRIENAGTIRKTTSGQTTFSNVALLNTGTVVVEDGTLNLSGGSTHSGNLAAGGATVEFSGGTHSFGTGSSLSVRTVRFSSGTTNIGGTLSILETATLNAGTVNITSSVNQIGAISISNGTLNLSATPNPLTVASLTLLAGTLSGSSTLSVSGLVTWKGGAMTGSGGVVAGGGLLIDGMPPKTLSRTLRNTGNATWTNVGDIVMGATGGLENAAAAVLHVVNDANITATSGAPVVENAGTIEKLTGSQMRIAAVFNNGGLVDLRSGVLILSGGGQDSGRFDVIGSRLQFDGGNHVLGPTARISGGDVEFSGGTVQLGGVADVAGKFLVDGGFVEATGSLAHSIDLRISGGSATFNLASGIVQASTLDLSSGLLGGSSDVVVSDSTMWSGGVMGGSGTTMPGNMMSISGSASKVLDRALVNAAATTWSGTGSISLGNGGRFDNTSSAIFHILTDAPITASAGSVFRNSGMFLKEAGGATRVDATFDNRGVVEVSAGSLLLNGGGTHTGSFAAPGTALEFGGNLHQFMPSSQVVASHVTTTAGTVQVDGSFAVERTTVNGGQATWRGPSPALGILEVSGATAILSAADGDVVLSSLILGFGTIDGSSTVTVTGPFDWAGGTLRGTGVLRAANGMTLRSSSPKVIQRRLENLGVASWTEAGNISIGAGGMLVNLAGARFDIETSGDVGIFRNGDGTISNSGTLRKRSANTTSVGVPILNDGLVEIDAGILLSRAAYIQSAGTTRMFEGTLQASPAVMINGGRLEGNGTIGGALVNGAIVSPGASPGRIAVHGDYVQTAAGTLAVEIAGTAVSQYDRLIVSGSATLAGGLTLTRLDDFVPPSPSEFLILSAAVVEGDFATTTGLSLDVGRGFLKRVGPTDVFLEYGEEDCADGLDNDGDGLADCGDPKCAEFLVCTFTPTPTPSPSASATATITTTPSITPTPTPRTGCAGDCNQDTQVTIDEILALVNIALGNSELPSCPAADISGDGMVTIDEIILAVGDALNDCPL